MEMTPFRRLVNLFQARFFENDDVSPDGGFETNVYQVMGFLAAPGFFITYLFMPALLEMATKHQSPGTQSALRIFRLFFPAFSFAVVGFATFFEWDKLFPDRRDFLILGPFPIRLRTMFAAKIYTLAVFLLMLIGAINFFPNVFGPLLMLAIPAVHEAGYLRVVGSQVGSTAGASLFAFFSVAALQGVLINVTTPYVFRKISPWIQMAGMCLMILALLLYPVCAMLLPAAMMTGARWVWLVPPVWFTGWYDLLLPPGNAFFLPLGWFALKALGAVVALFCASWALGFRRHYRRTLEAEDTEIRTPRASLFDRLSGSPEQSAIFRFTGRMLARSATHRLFLACYWSVGLAIGLLTAVVVSGGHVGLSEDGLRSLPLLIAFFVVSGFRAAFQFPAELSSNWLFRITEDRWAETSRRATRIRVLASGLIPALVLFLPFEMAHWGLVAGAYHAAFQLATGAVLVEILFWSFDKVPFTCSWFPGKVSLALLAGVYLYGFTEYGFRMADLERLIENHPVYGFPFFAAAAVALVIFHRRRPRASAVRFDGNEPEIQSLNLT